MARWKKPKKGRALLVLPGIPDDAPEELKNALALRNACVTEGKCPDCGAEADIWTDAQGLGHLSFEHEDWCRAFTDPPEAQERYRRLRGESV